MDVINKTLVLVGGKQGAGKSTTAAMIAPNANYSADMYGQYDEQGNYLKERAPQAHAACLDDTKLAMARGEKIIAVHNTFRTERQRIDYLIWANIFGYNVIVIEVNGGMHADGSPTTNIHNVPQEIVDNFEWEPHQPPIPVLNLEAHVKGVAQWLETTPEQMWVWVKAMAKDDWQSVSSEIRRNKDFWRLVNSFRYWNETQQYFAWEAIRINHFEREMFLQFWETDDFYKVTIDEIEERFNAYLRQFVGV